MTSWNRLTIATAAIAIFQCVRPSGGEPVTAVPPETAASSAQGAPAQHASPDDAAVAPAQQSPKPGGETPPAAKLDESSADTAKQDETPPAAKPDSVTPPAAKPDNAAEAKNIETIEPGETVAVLGKKVVGPDGKDVMGPVTDVLVGSDGQPRAAVIDFGGFLGVGSRRVAIDWQSLKFRPGNSDAPLELTLKPDEIKSAPEYKDPKTPTKVVEPAPQPVQTSPSVQNPPAVDSPQPDQAPPPAESPATTNAGP